MNYTARERQRAARWKATSTTLPESARIPAPYVTKSGRSDGTPYPFCLPARHSALSLLPEARDLALTMFAELGIPWHAGVDGSGGGPSNHLLSSQVQCVNALAPMVRDPARVIAAFGQHLDIAEVLEIEPGRHLTFEYIGPTDFFGESPSGDRVRGAHCTSVDAAFCYRTTEGQVELALVEWKYTESYRKRRPEAKRDEVRARRYAAFVADPEGPVRDDVLDFGLLLDEPLYQLVRQQLLAHELEKASAEGASTVRVLHVLSPANVAYQGSLPRAEQRAIGGTVSEVWQRLLRSPYRFLTVDPRVFHDPEVTSREYALRYADDVYFDQADLVAGLELAAVSDLEDLLYAEEDFDGDVVASADGVELILGRVGTLLGYPFREQELRTLARELAS
ncbi:hypothetical protein G7072_18180 [Nocardioides sp. HDW12B]|uniref:PGN_0703 family putative restriction endonuclease n=1 Tax=Nocardioides sp. HDW12B TaxID=2714939 RepID=UPI001408FA5E|nr:hypothetical protein [Nocardioides sp. HDW12B]QIK68015.1 hypothetical protein G7072_18180 [Nocardioides sp. HDW12B]